MNRIAILEHNPLMAAYQINHWLSLRELEGDLYQLHQNPALPALDSFDVLIILGGEMAVEDAAQYPWLSAEKALIQTAIESGKHLLGIGLGCQLLAQALGGEVRPLDGWQIGWWPLEKAPQAQQSPIGRMLPQQILPLHWHNHGYTRPQGAIPLYRAANGMEQSFVWQERVIGLQFHLECTAQSINSWLAQQPTFTPVGDVQSTEAIHDGSHLSCALRTPLFRLLDYLSGPHPTLC